MNTPFYSQVAMNLQLAKLLTASAFEHGYQARVKDRGLNSNPFPRGSQDRLAWERGWNQANRNLTH